MHVELPGKRLQPLVKATTTVAKESDIRPILRNILLEATDEGLEISATDTTVSLWLAIPDAKVHRKGKALIPAQNLQRTLALDTMSKHTITIDVDGNVAHVRAGASDFDLLTEDYRDFPAIPRFAGGKPWISVPSPVLAKLLGRVVFCAHSERSHFNMHGVLFRCQGKELTVVATNGQRLGVASYDNVTHSGEPVDYECVIPAEAAAALKKISSGDEAEHTDIQFLARSMRARSNLGSVSLVPLSGSFPPYEMGVPNTPKKITFDRLKLIDLLKQASVLKGAASNFIEVEFQPGKVVMQMSVRDAGNTKIEHPTSWQFDPLSVMLNPDFVSQSATAMDGTSVDLELDKVVVPTILREHDDDGISSYCVFSVVRK